MHSTSVPAATGNSVRVRFLDTAFTGSGGRENMAAGLGRADVTAQAHHGSFSSKVYPGNGAVLELQGCTSDGTPVYFDHSHPDDPGQTNRVTFIGGAGSLDENNHGIPGAVEFDYDDIE